MFGLSETASQGGLSSPTAFVPIVAGLALVAAFVYHALHTSVRPLLDLTLFRAPGFAAAAAVVFLIGAALFGSLARAAVVLPGRPRPVDAQHRVAARAGQGIGAALTMPISGRLTDRIGGGRVVLFGMVVMTLATVALTRFDAHTPYTTTCAILVVRGIGLGCSLMPAMASAYTTISRAAIPRATTALNVLQRVGGSIDGAPGRRAPGPDQGRGPGRLGHRWGAIAPLPPAVRARIAEPLATAFSHTFWYAAALTGVAILPAIVLAITVRGPASAAAASEPPGATQAA